MPVSNPIWFRKRFKINYLYNDNRLYHYWINNWFWSVYENIISVITIITNSINEDTNISCAVVITFSAFISSSWYVETRKDIIHISINIAERIIVQSPISKVNLIVNIIIVIEDINRINII